MSYEPEQLELAEIGNAVIKSLEQVSVLNATLYTAVTFMDRDPEDIAQQFPSDGAGKPTMPPEEIQRRVSYVRERIRHELEKQELINLNSFR